MLIGKTTSRKMQGAPTDYTDDADRKKLIYPELSYGVVGILYRVHNELGGAHQEKHYQRAVEEGLKKGDLRYEREIPADLEFEGAKIGKHIFDFLIEGKILLELKAIPRLGPGDFRQVLSYLRTSGLKLGILANFRGDKVKVHRVLNANVANEYTNDAYKSDSED
jgi:GxxExxY protein